MEGIYLHNLIFLYIFNDNSSIMAYVFAGWGLSLHPAFTCNVSQDADGLLVSPFRLPTFRLLLPLCNAIPPS